MIIKKGTADVTTYFKLIDVSTGAAKTGLTITDLDATYVRDGAASSKADLTALAAVDSAHADNKAIEVDGTNCPGLYRVDWPDAAFLTGVSHVQLCVNGAAIDPAYIEVELVNYDAGDGVRFGLTALPNAIPGQNGGLCTTNGTKQNQTVDLTAGQSVGISGDLSATMKTSVQTAADAAVTANTKIVAIEADTNELQTDWTNGGRLDLLVDAIKAITDQINFTGTDVNANASVSLTEGDITDIAAGVAAAIKLTTGWTSGGTLTYAEVVKIIAAAVAGKVIDKVGVAGTIQHLDVEDGTTPIFENIPSNTTSPYRDPTIL